MAKRELTEEEAAALGLTVPTKKRRELSAEEAQALGLDAPAPPTPLQSALLAGANMAAQQLGPRAMALESAQDAVLGPRGDESVTDLPSAGRRIASLYGRNWEGAKRLLSDPTGTLDTAAAAYDEALAGNRRGFQAVHDANKKASFGGMIGGAMLGGPRTLGQSVVSGMLSMAGGTDADYGKILNGDGSEALKAGTDIGLGGLFSLGGYGLGKGAGWVVKQGGRPFAALAQRAQRGINEAVAEATERATTKAEKEAASLLGKYRSKISEASRDLEVLERTAADTSLPSSNAARAFLDSADGVALRESVLATKLVTAPERIAEMGAAKQASQAAAAAKPQAIADGIEQQLGQPVRRQILPRAKLVASRLIPPMVGSYFGGEIGGTEGTLIGGGLGLGTALVMGRPGTVMANLLRSPGFRKMGWEGVKKATSLALPSAVDGVAAPLGSAVGRGEGALLPSPAAAFADSPDRNVKERLALIEWLRARRPEELEPAP